ncbi:MAG TPA: alpha/beta hydrolase [Chthoniobacterales bacterium]|nr:alpha/beta hydrolase [Chthoniobacterales bacterium]
MNRGSTIAMTLVFASLAYADDLPRRVKAPRESYPNVDVTYDSVRTEDGKRLRTIVTRPHNATGKLPVIFVVGWLSCDSVEAPVDTKDDSGLVFRALAQLPQFVLFRVDKQGVGDSEGVCGETDFKTELGGYRAAFHALRSYDFIDPNRIFILGISNGGGFAPLVPSADEQQQVRGYVAVGGWVKTWFEHMLEIERRRFALMGKSPFEVNQSMELASILYYEWLIGGRSVDDILKARPQLAEIWPEGKDTSHLYGRPLRFYQDLQAANLAAAWSRVKAPTYVLHGAFDWIMSREDSELIAQYVNKNGNLATFYEIPNTGHTFQHYLSLADAFNGKRAAFDPKVIALITDWLRNKAITHED